MTCLCSKCFQDKGDFPEYCNPPAMNICAVCGAQDDRYSGGPVVTNYAGDPRKVRVPGGELLNKANDHTAG